MYINQTFIQAFAWVDDEHQPLSYLIIRFLIYNITQHDKLLHFIENVKVLSTSFMRL